MSTKLPRILLKEWFSLTQVHLYALEYPLPSMIAEKSAYICLWDFKTLICCRFSFSSSWKSSATAKVKSKSEETKVIIKDD